MYVVEAENRILPMGEPFELNGVLYPSNWLQYSTPEELAAIGIIEVAEEPMPDEFYAVVVPDPDNPGQWLTTPYSAEEMKPRLEQYSRAKRDERTNAGVMHTIGGDEFLVPTDQQTRNAFFDYRIIQERPGAPVQTPYDFGTKVVALSEGALLDIEQKMEDRVHDCLIVQLNLQASIEAGTTTTKEQIDAAYVGVP